MDVRDAEHVEIFVPLPVEEVRQRLVSATSTVLVPLGSGTFQGSVKERGFELRLNRMRRQNLRPWLKGTLEPAEGGTLVRATAAAPAWARPLGRGLVVASLAMGATIAGTLLIGGQPADMSDAGYWMLLAASAWMPVVAIALPGLLVNESVQERGDAIAALRALFPEARQAAADPVSLPRDQSLSEAVQGRARPDQRVRE